MRRSALSPRAAAAAFEDLATRDQLIGRQRIDRYRLRRRVARRARHVARRIGIAAVVLLLLGASGMLGGWLLRSPRFEVASVEVRGQSRLSREEIEATAAIEPGENIFTLDTREVVARLLRELQATLQSPEVRERIERQAMDLTPLSTEAMAALAREQSEIWRRLTREAGIKPE